MSRTEKFISDYTKNCSNAIYDPYDTGDAITIYAPWLTPDQARGAVEIAREEIYGWLLNHNDYITVNGNVTRFDMEKLVENLKQAMKDE